MSNSSEHLWPIEACPHCGRKYRIDPALAERKMRCRGCEKFFRIRGDGGGKRTLDELVKTSQGSGGSGGAGGAIPGAGAVNPKAKPGTSNRPAPGSAKPAVDQQDNDAFPNLLDEVISSLHSSGLEPAKPNKPPRAAAKAAPPTAPKPAAGTAKPPKPPVTQKPPKPANPPESPEDDLPLLDEVPE